MSSQELIDPEKIIATIEALQLRINERFPNAGLGKVCAHLLSVAENMKKRADWIARPVGWLRALTWAICLLVIAATIGTFFAFGLGEDKGRANRKSTKKPIEAVGENSGSGTEANSDNSVSGDESEESDLSFVDFVTVLEAGINDVVLIGAAMFFLFSIETRYKRSRALKALHELRSIAHIIDMHQLTKDPQRVNKKDKAYASGKMSPKFQMTSFELRRYLDYCSELLSLTGKIAAVYVQAFDDGVAMASASELETLTTGLSSKIWQKILVLEASAPSAKTENSPKIFSKPRAVDHVSKQEDLEGGQNSPEKEPLDEDPPDS